MLNKSKKERILFWKSQLKWHKNYYKCFPESKLHSVQSIKRIKKYIKEIKKEIKKERGIV